MWDSYGLSDYKLRSGSFNEDSRGRWYFNVVVDVKKPEPSKGKSSVGVDLGLKEFATFSDGFKVEAQRLYRDLEPKLAIAQRSKNAKKVKSIHAKIANRRKDFLLKLSTRVVAEYGVIFVGNVSSKSLVKTTMAKSVLDSGWGIFRSMLTYKGNDAGCVVREVNEAFSTQDCSKCHDRGGPKGRSGLGIRAWRCVVCGSDHDRDVNAARNILFRGLKEFEDEFSFTVEAKADEIVENKADKSAAAGHGRPVEGIRRFSPPEGVPVL